MLGCNQVNLERYLDEELPRGKRVRMDRHLSSCAQCRSRLEALRQQGALLRVRFEEAAARVDFAGFEDRLLERVRKQGPAPVRERLTVWLREAVFHFRAVWVTAAVTAVLVLAVLVPLLTRTPESPSTGAELARVDNEVIIDSMEYSGQRSMIFKVSKNNTTVIWLYDYDRIEQERGDEL